MWIRQTDRRSYYFLVPDGISEIHFYASVAGNLQLFYLDEFGIEQKDGTFNPAPRAYNRTASPAAVAACCGSRVFK